MKPFYYGINYWITCSILMCVLLSACGPTAEEIRIGALDHFNRGNVHLEQREYQQAISEYEKAIVWDPNQEIFYYNMGLAYFELVLYDSAIDAYQRAIELKPDFGEAYFNLSLCLYKKGRTEEAFLANKKYLEIGNRKPTPPAVEKE